MRALQEFVDSFTYLGIFVLLLLGSLGVPVPEGMPIIAAAVLSHEGIVRWMADVHRAERWLFLAGLLVVAAMLVIGLWRWHRRVANERLDEEPAQGHSPSP